MKYVLALLAVALDDVTLLNGAEVDALLGGGRGRIVWTTC